MPWILLGVSLAIAFLGVARRGTGTNHVIGNGLVVAALIYVGFVVMGGASSIWLAIEMIGVVVYATFAWLGINRSAVWLGIGWALHIAWDVGLHQYGSGSGFTPFWYPPLCIGFDLVVVLGLTLNWKGRVTVERRR